MATVVAPFEGLDVLRLGVEEGHFETCSQVAEMVRGNASLLCECKVCAPRSAGAGRTGNGRTRSPNETESSGIRDESSRTPAWRPRIIALRSGLCAVRVCRPLWHGSCSQARHEAARGAGARRAWRSDDPSTHARVRGSGVGRAPFGGKRATSVVPDRRSRTARDRLGREPAPADAGVGPAAAGRPRIPVPRLPAIGLRRRRHRQGPAALPGSARRLEVPAGQRGRDVPRDDVRLRRRRRRASDPAYFDTLITLAYVTPTSQTSTFETTFSLREAYALRAGVWARSRRPPSGRAPASTTATTCTSPTSTIATRAGSAAASRTSRSASTLRLAVAWIGGSQDQLDLERPCRRRTRSG